MKLRVLDRSKYINGLSQGLKCSVSIGVIITDTQWLHQPKLLHVCVSPHWGAWGLAGPVCVWWASGDGTQESGARPHTLHRDLPWWLHLTLCLPSLMPCPLASEGLPTIYNASLDGGPDFRVLLAHRCDSLCKGHSQVSAPGLCSQPPATFFLLRLWFPLHLVCDIFGSAEIFQSLVRLMILFLYNFFLCFYA